jgi:hypothetical protein
MANLLTRAYNSTLGVPQQFLFRFLKAMQDEDIDLFSREGILAPELLPVLGVAASHETDLSAKDVFGDNGFVGNLALDILTDPATFLTAGATGIAKAGKAVNKSRITSGLFKKGGKEMKEAGIDVMAHKTAGDLRKSMMVAAQDGKLTTRSAKNAIKELGKVDADTLVTDMLKSTGKEDLLISIPGLARWGAEVRAPQALQKHKSWFAFQNAMVYGKAVETSKPVLAWMGTKIRGMGDVGEVLMDQAVNAAGIPQAFKKGVAGLDSKFRLESGKYGNDEMAAANFRVSYGAAAREIEKTDIQQTVKKLRKKLAKGASLDELVRTSGVPKDLREEILGWPKSKEHPVAIDAMPEKIGEFLLEIQTQGRQTKRTIDEAMGKFRKKTKESFGHWTGDAAFEIGQTVRKGIQLVFHRNEPVTKEWLKEIQDNYLERKAKAHIILESVQKEQIQHVQNIADATGHTPEKIKKILNIHTEGTIHPLDVAANRAAMIKGGRHAVGAKKNYADILGRMRGTIEGLRIHTNLDKDTLKWLDALDATTLEVMTSKGMHFDRRELIELMAEDLAPEVRHLAGKRIADLSDSDLTLLQRPDSIPETDLRKSVQQVLLNRKNAKEYKDISKAPQLTVFRPEEVVKSRRIEDLDMDSLKARHAEAPLGSELRKRLGDTIKKKTQGKPPKKAYLGTEVPETLLPTTSKPTRLDQLDEDGLKAQIRATDDPVLRKNLRDTLKKLQKGQKPKKAIRSIEVNHPLGDNLTPEMDILAKYELALADLAQGRFTAITLHNLESGTQALGRLLPEQAKAVLKGADPKDLDAVFGLSDDATRLAHQANGFSMGAPLGYLPRLRNRSRDRALSTLVGRMDDQVALKGVASNMKKRLDNGRSLTLDEIGTVNMDLAKSGTAEGKALAAEVDEFLKKEGLAPGIYQEDHLDIMIGRMGRDFEHVSSAKLIEDAFNHEKAGDIGMVGGRIVQVFDDYQVPIIHKDVKKTGVKAGKKGTKQTTKAAETYVPARTIVIETSDGRRIPLDLHEIQAEGKSVELLGTDADTLGNAFVAHQLGGANLNPLKDAREGQWVVTGGDDVLSMFRGNVVPPPSKWADALSVYDYVNFTLKHFQTVLRPAHSFGNLLSGIFQSQAAGASVGSIAAANIDVTRVMFGLDEALEITGAAARATGTKRVLTASRRTVDGIHGLMSGRKLGSLVDEAGTVKNKLGQEASHLDIWSEALENGLLTGTFAGEELKIGGHASGVSVERAARLEALRFKDERTWGEGVSNFWKEIEGATKIPEIHARMTTVYALYYDGHSIPDAVKLATDAHVDYSKLGIGERQVLKRMIPFYTFSRNYVPYALEKMARNPRLIAPWKAAVENSGLMGVDSNGKVVFEKGKFQLDLGRSNANIDALMAVMGVAEHLLPGNIATVKGIQSVETPGFMGLGSGGFAGVVKGAMSDDGFSADSTAKALIDATFVGRFFENLYDTAVERDLNPINDFVTSMVIPARINNDPNKSRQFQANMARRALRRIELSLKEAKSPQEAQGLLQEANDIKQALLTVQQDFGN